MSNKISQGGAKVKQMHTCSHVKASAMRMHARQKHCTFGAAEKSRRTFGTVLTLLNDMSEEMGKRQEFYIQVHMFGTNYCHLRIHSHYAEYIHARSVFEGQ